MDPTTMNEQLHSFGSRPKCYPEKGGRESHLVEPVCHNDRSMSGSAGEFRSYYGSAQSLTLDHQLSGSFNSSLLRMEPSSSKVEKVPRTLGLIECGVMRHSPRSRTGFDEKGLVVAPNGVCSIAPVPRCSGSPRLYIKRGKQRKELLAHRRVSYVRLAPWSIAK